MTTTMQLIAKQTVGANNASSITFSNIPQTYTDLKVVVSFRGTSAELYEVTALRFNGLNANLSSRSIESNGSAIGSINNGYIYFGSGNGNNTTANTFSNMEAYIPNYTSSNYKSVNIDAVGENNGSTIYMQLTAGLWSSTAAINSIEIVPTGSFKEFSTFYLYGISNNITTQSTSVPYASGGDVITTDGTYWYHAFKTSGSFKPLKDITTDVLVVAGGGGSGALGGGGAGGLRILSNKTFTSNISYTCVVGAGGAARSGATGSGVPNVYGTSGTNSSINGNGFSTISATGGGVGSDETTPAAQTGGSGGGACLGSAIAGNAGGYTPVEGYAGGTGNSVDQTAGGGGGGGAGAVGGTAYVVVGTSTSGTGGNGLSNSIINTMGAATKTGQLSGGNYYYAGGGSGGVYRFGTTSGGTVGAAGLGGGGTGGFASTAATSGTPNTGGGAGADGYKTNGWLADAGGGTGGSGIIIIRYAVA